MSAIGKSRLEAFSDGVLAIIITIMVLELKVPHGDTLEALQPMLSFVTGWAGEHLFASLPTMLYGIVLLMSAIAYYILQQRIIAREGRESTLGRAVGRDYKGKLSPLIYLVAILSVGISPWIAVALYVLVALMWLLPDRRIERVTNATG